ncbi:MAG: YdeI/OmpD-associated family protein [Bacteroidia bacterium]|nr:YdeI/OmpD-associated family protein [Bacteroidia bacterium]
MNPEKFTFSAEIEIIGVNPYVFLPEEVLLGIFNQAGKNKGPIPVRGKIDHHPFIQTLVKYSGAWRLYLNGPMRDATQTTVGDFASFELSFDPVPRDIPMHPKLELALDENQEAKTVFEGLSPSRQKEIVRYIANLKSEESVDRNVARAISFLKGEERFVGRDKP